MERVAIDTAHLGKPDVIPKVEGRQMVMIIYPNT
jgi:translation initiation factor IF-3